MSALATNPVYAALLVNVSPRVIRSDEQNEAYLAALYEMEQRRERWGAEESELADLLTLLIEDYEEKHYALPKSSPAEALKLLMDQHGLKQKDRANVFGTASIMFEILRGKREMNKQQIRRLSEQFRVSPEVFF